ncbi:serine/threonine-protein kinase [Pseudonocardia yuanmonensis]|uniref:non-specific serine/threonine protein kinase n=1 Tax=Pseudonocardia yuanmonensis TaxID=1095914 RepID=A0ABP8VYW9_9PSEU
MDSGTDTVEDRLGERYRLDELIGVGGTAHVHRATDLQTGRAVAVKVLHPGIDVRRLGVRGLDEVPRHPALVEVLDSGVDGEGGEARGYVVMQLVDGGSLADLVELGPVPAERVITIGTVIAGALAHLHALGVVHRDVKPANVLLDRTGRAFLADLGVARLLDATRVTTMGLAVGTPAYMAPEQVQGREVGPPADVYALGLVLLEGLTGRREYAGAALESAVARIHRRPDVPPHLDPPLRTLLIAMTADEPTARPTAAEVAVRLGDLAVHPATAPLPAPTAPARHRSPASARPRRRVLTALAGGVAAAGGLVVLGTSLLSGPDPVAPAVAVPTPAPAAPVEPTLQPVPHLATAAGDALEQATPTPEPAAPTRAPRVVLRDEDEDEDFEDFEDRFVDEDEDFDRSNGNNGNGNGNGRGRG